MNVLDRFFSVDGPYGGCKREGGIFFTFFAFNLVFGVLNFIVLMQGFNWFNTGVGFANLILAALMWQGIDTGGGQPWIRRFVDWRNKYIWPWNTIQRWYDLWLSTDQWADRLLKEKMDLRHDLAETGRWISENGILTTRMVSDGMKPIRIAYTREAPKISEVKNGPSDVSYIMSTPKIYSYRPDVDKLHLMAGPSASIIVGNIADSITAEFREDLVTELKRVMIRD